MTMQSGGQRSAQNVSGSTDLKDIKAMLPSMQVCDIVAFSHPLSEYFSCMK